MPWFVAPSGDRRLAGQDAAASLDPGCQARDGRDQLEGRPDGALRVVLARRRRPPDGHHRIADELLDGPAVPGHDRRRHLEVPALHVADVLGVVRLRERREPDEVGEQHADQAALGDRRGWGRGGDASGSASGDAMSEVPQLPQKRFSAGLTVPHTRQTTVRAVPHRPQNRCPGAASAPH